MPGRDEGQREGRAAPSHARAGRGWGGQGRRPGWGSGDAAVQTRVQRLGCRELSQRAEFPGSRGRPHPAPQGSPKGGGGHAPAATWQGLLLATDTVARTDWPMATVPCPAVPREVAAAPSARGPEPSSASPSRRSPSGGCGCHSPRPGVLAWPPWAFLAASKCHYQRWWSEHPQLPGLRGWGFGGEPVWGVSIRGSVDKPAGAT